MCSAQRIHEVARDILEGMHLQGLESLVFRGPDSLVGLLDLRKGTTVNQIHGALELLQGTQPHATIVLRRQPDGTTELVMYERLVAS